MSSHILNSRSCPLELGAPTRPWLATIVKEPISQPCIYRTDTDGSDTNSSIPPSIFSTASSHSTVPSIISESTDSTGARILSMDGGGIKAASITMILDAVMDLLIRNGLPGDTKPSDVWNVFCGSSAGGFLAFLFSRGFTPLGALAAWKRFSKRIFKTSKAKRAYNLLANGSRFGCEKLESVLKEMVLEITGDENTVLAKEEDEYACIIVTVPAASFNHPKPVLFTSKSIPGMQSSSNVPIWKILRATSAAPSYFPPQEISGQLLIDGGCGFNNPTELAISCAKRFFPQTGIESILSVGCGETKARTTGNVWATFKALKSLITDTTVVHSRMEDIYGPSGEGIYTRLEVDGGMGSKAGLSDWRKLEFIADSTAVWLSEGNGKEAVELLANQMTLSASKSRRTNWTGSYSS